MLWLVGLLGRANATAAAIDIRCVSEMLTSTSSSVARRSASLGVGREGATIHDLNVAGIEAVHPKSSPDALPPGTSNWHKIEHRLFSQITRNWRGRPLTSHETIINLIGACHHNHRADRHRPARHRPYPTGVKVSDWQMKDLPIIRHPWHGGWNYTISAHSVLA